jgi:hypothetical protein
MKTILLLFIPLLAMIQTLPAQQWASLYNGKDLDGWEHVGEGSFEIENGLLKTVGGMGLLWYTGQKFENVKIRVVYKGGDESNAGVFIRIPEEPTEPWMPVNRGYEVQIAEGGDAHHSTGTLYSFTEAKASPGKSEWNELIITLTGDRTKVEVNGTLVTDFKEGDPVPPKVEDYEPDRGPRLNSGYIGLQNHAEDDVVYFKEVSVREL